MKALLSTTYFGPVSWYSALCHADVVWLEACESYQKQTYRNRCVIGSEGGPLPLTVPVSSADGEKEPYNIINVRASDHGQWRHLHWQALVSAYRDTPFFEYYADDLQPFFLRKDWPTLWQLNEAVRETMCRLLDISPRVQYTSDYVPASEVQPDVVDLRQAISPKAHHAAEATLAVSLMPQERQHWQPFLSRHGYMPGLSILDLLFCMGPEAKLYL